MFCRGTFSKRGMARHLRSCEARKRHDQELAESQRKRARRARLFHIVVESEKSPLYWLHLEVAAAATLLDLDDFLREIWLECCGNLSRFRIEGADYMVEEFEEPTAWPFFLGRPTYGMDVPLWKVLRPGIQFGHEYDFGSTTRLALRVLSDREGWVGREYVMLMARNDPPVIRCAVCGGLATKVCSACVHREERWFCDECASKHGCEENCFLPIVNSPRVGVCGYTGSVQ